MIARAGALSIFAGLGILAAAAAGVVALRGAEADVLRGTVLGASLGAAGLALEALLVARALSLPRGEALRIVVAGFGIRLGALGVGVLLLRDGGFADPASFALSFVGGFLAGLPAVAAAAFPLAGGAGARP